MFYVHDIFRTISGEVNHQHQGRMATFIRFQECNLRCSWCDTLNAQDKAPVFTMTLADIMRQVKLLKCHNVVVTGGEPLLQNDLIFLLDALNRRNYQVTVETNGSQKITAQMHDLAYWVVDYKLPSSGMQKLMNPLAFTNLKRTDFIKFVVQDETDLDVALGIKDYLILLNPRLALATFAYSPVLGKIEVPTIFRWLEKTAQFNALVSVQIHKLFQIP